MSIITDFKNIFAPVRPNFKEIPGSTPSRNMAESLGFDTYAKLLPYSGYDEENKLFIIDSNKPDVPEGVGFVLELIPQIGAPTEMADLLSQLFMLGRSSVPNIGIQVQMIGLPFINTIVDRMVDVCLKPDQSPYPEQAETLIVLAQNRAEHYRKLTQEPLSPTMSYRLRSFRSNISIIYPCSDITENVIKDILDVREIVINTLRQYYLFSHIWSAHDLVNNLNLILNPHLMMKNTYQEIDYDPFRMIRDQIINHDTVAKEHEKEIVFSSSTEEDVWVRTMSVSKYPQSFTLSEAEGFLGSTTNLLAGYPCPFVLTMGATCPAYDSESNRTAFKAARALQVSESPLGRFIPNAKHVAENWKLAQNSFLAGKGTCRIYHQLLLFDRAETIQRATSSVKNNWSSMRFEMNTDVMLQRQGFIASLPMLYGPLLQNDLVKSLRSHTKTIVNAANMMPIIGEWTGTSARAKIDQYPRPALVLMGRRGQPATIDIFANPSGNYNFAVAAASGSGKSFFVNELAQRYLALGGRAWIIDVGRSYEKLCRLLGGTYIEFDNNATFSMNPFGMVKYISGINNNSDNTDQDDDMKMIKPLIAQMAAPSTGLDDYQMAQLEKHIRHVYAQYGNTATITHLARSLRTNHLLSAEEFIADINVRQFDESDNNYEIRQEKNAAWLTEINTKSADERRAIFGDIRIQDIGNALYPYTENGAYSKFFRADGDQIEFDGNFFVLELEQLKAMKDLQSVVLLLIMYRISNAMYMSDRSIPKLGIIDEAWDLMGSGSSGKFIEEGYRRVRKYGGAFGTLTQAIKDYYRSGTSQAAFSNADWWFFLRQKKADIEFSIAENQIVIDEWSKKQLFNLTTVEGLYSEVYVKGGDMPPSVLRLIADPYAKLSASTNPNDVAAIQELRDRGMSVHAAIEKVLEQRSSR